MDLHIIYQDNHLFVVKKDYNMTIQTLDEAVKSYLVSQKEKVGYLERLYALDTLVSGVVVYILTSKAMERIRPQDVACRYLAVTVGSPATASGYFSANVEDLGNGKLGIAPPIEKSFGIDFYYKLMETKSQISLINITASNSAANAIRFGLSQQNSPVFGDKLYGGDSLAPNTNLALMLYCVELEHPTTHSKMVFGCTPVSDTKPWSYFNLDKILKY